ncbi:F-box domain [Arabidopsis suecica]|uniref:F-box domain n=1 Tax=Arabidopsis suecica TaxID=45249 RepID=A0A8T1XWS1_ARASU|nr:F-box domain [Arabidopsis suecica]
MAGVLAGECSYSDIGVSSLSRNSHEKQDKVEMRGSCFNSNLAHHIPLDLTIEILTRLPVKSLKRFQCVSKEWISIIRNQVFIDSFFSMSQTRSRFLVAVRIAENRVILLSSSHNETEVPTTSLVTNLQMPIRGCRLSPIRYTSLHTNLEMTVSGLPVDLVHCSSIHGLFCFVDPSDPGRFTICNPSTRQVITLPDTKAFSGRRKSINMFLGYDPVGNEYKVLCSTAVHGEPCQVHKVLTIGGGNLSWRSIKGRKIPRYIVVTNGICIDGMVYYGGLTTKRQEKKLWIFRFNVRSEGISSISTYPQVTNHGSLINYNGKVAAASPLPRAPRGSFDLWVLDDFDEKRRWLRSQFNVHPLVLHLSGKTELKILGMNRSNEVVIGPLKVPPKHEPLYIYYFHKGGQKLIRRVELKGFEEFRCNHTSDEQCVCQVIFSPEHFESLVSL